MEVQIGPNPVDEPSLLYKLQRKIKVFNTGNALANRGYNLVTSSSKYGIVFIGSPVGILSAYHLRELIDKDCEPKHLAVKLAEKPTHIAVSCDEELLATTGGQLLCVYKVADFQNGNVSPVVTLKLDSNPSSFVSALQWNPCILDNIAIAFFDGMLAVSSVGTGQVKKVQAKARCICWSPKGKQIVTGNSDGSLCQYKPDLTLAKMVPPPNIFEGSPVEALAIYWISTFQFAVVFRNASNNSRPVVTILNTPKTGTPTCLNYEDICYSMDSNRPWYYYLLGLAQWNMIMASSSNGMEIATLGSADGANWLQWCQSDEARPELPLTDKKIENYPVGLSIDTSGVHQLPWGENETLPHMPLLLVVSQCGWLTIFNIINLKKDAVQVCTPHQMTPLSLPAGALTSELPDDAPTEVTLPPPPSAAAKPPPAVQPFGQQLPQQPPPSFAASQMSAMLGQTKPFGMPPQNAPAFSTALPPSVQAPEPKKEVKPSAPIPTQAQPLPKPQPAEQKPPSQASEQSAIQSAALKAEQERVNKLKADQELKNMLVKEVNDFQMELYKFMVNTKDMQNKLQKDLDSIDANFSLQTQDTEQLKKDCALEDLRTNIIQLKLELVRACAVVAEARTHAEAKDSHQWSQVDPLTNKRVSSVKNLAYYVQTQLEQAHKALDYKWNEMLNRDPQYNKPGQRMIRPVLDDVYQPLVKQQEILARQQAVLRTLRNTLNEVDATPMFKSTSLLRSTPFKKDPLSKLTKNILNMSIEPQTKPKDTLLSAQKLDALRDMLSNHKPTKIKPVNVELRQHLAQMKVCYEKSLKDDVKPVTVKTEPAVSLQKPVVPPQAIKAEIVKAEPAPMFRPFGPPMSVQPAAPASLVKPDLITKQAASPQLNIPSFTPVSQFAKPTLPGLNNVARTLFTEEPSKPLVQNPPAQIKPQLFAPTVQPNASANTKNILKDMLQNKQAHASPEPKSDANTFMGQKICSPTAFSLQTPTSQQPSLSFSSKPISDISNMFSKFTPQPLPTEPKLQTAHKVKEISVTDTISKVESKKEEPIATPLQFKSPVPSSTTPVPVVLKKKPVKLETLKIKVEKLADKIEDKPSEKESEKSDTSLPKATEEVKAEKKENAPKSFSFGSSKPGTPLFGATATPTVLTSPSIIGEPSKSVEKEAETKADTPKEEESEKQPPSPSASSLFAAANAASPTAAPKLQPLFGSATSTQSSIFGSPPSTPPVESSADTETKESSPSVSAASSLFATAVAAQPKTTPSGSIFSSPPSPSSVFGSTGGSIFGTSTTTTTQSSTSVFGVPSPSENKPSVFSTHAPSSPSAVFAAAAASTAQPAFGSSTSSVFATTPTTTAESPVFGSTSVFGTATTASQPTSVFGSATATTTTPSVFGSSSSASIFGSAAAAQSSAFGSPTTTASSVFGSAPATTQASIFGSPATTQASFFGAATPTTQSSVFGTATTQASVFGSPTPSTQASVFGSPTPSTQASVFGGAPAQSSVFGSSAQTTQASIFGSQPTTTAAGSLFGAGDNLFAAASISTTSASSPTSGGSIFGGGSPASVFGSGGGSPNVFGSKSSFSQANPQAAAIFGAAGAASTFGQKPAGTSNFWGGNGTSTSSGFGSSGFGQQATTQASSIFGSATGGSFSSPSGGSAFGSPQPQASSVFGSPQAAPAFGGSPVFGAKPGFGQPAGFGSPPSGGGSFGGFGGFNKSPSTGFGGPASFGGAPAFGGTGFGNTSPGKMFGGAAAAPSFGATQSNATFEAMATQNTLTFGNLAQQTSQPAQPAPSFNTSPSFTGWRG